MPPVGIREEGLRSRGPREREPGTARRWRPGVVSALGLLNATEPISAMLPVSTQTAVIGIT
jgi:hypothetical protein